MRASTAYFVGGATIVTAIAIGLGGGIVAGNIMNPVTPKVGADAGKVAQRASPSTEHATTGSAPSGRVQFLTETTAFGATIAPAQAESQAKPEAASQSTSASAEPQAPQPSQPVAVNDTAAVAPPPAAPVKSVDQAPDRSLDKPAVKQVAVEPKGESKAESKAASKAEAKMEAKAEAKPAEAEPAATPENAFAKARDSDVRRATSERRRAERRRDWSERRRHEARDPREMRDRTDWDDVARNIREDSDPRNFASSRRGYNPPPDRGFPRINLFGPDDD